MKLSGIIIGTLVSFVAILAVIGYPGLGAPGFFPSLIQNYGRPADIYEMNNTFREMNPFFASINQTEQQISTSTITEASPTETWSNQVWSTLKLAFKPGVVFKAMMVDVSSAIGAPAWVVVVAGMIFTIVLVYAFISVLKGWNA